MRKKILILSFFVLLLDQITKFAVIRYMNLFDSIQIIKNFLYITYVQNEGAAWNILQGSRWLFIILSIFALYAVIKYFLLDENIVNTETLGYSLLIGGVSGNLIDRVVHGYVIDFIDFRIFNYNFPVFNVADSSIVIGALLVAWSLYGGSKK